MPGPQLLIYSDCHHKRACNAVARRIAEVENDIRRALGLAEYRVPKFGFP